MNPNGTQHHPSKEASSPLGGNAKNVSYLPSVPNFFNAYMQPLNSLPATKWHKETIIERLSKVQRNPFADPTQISKGQTTTTGGGSFALYDKTGGTALFSYNPATGVITINGSLVSNVVNSGTYQNIILAGTNTVNGTMIHGVYGTPSILSGTMNNGVFGTPSLIGGTVGTSLIQGGTLNPDAYQTGGTAGLSATVAFIRSGTISGTLTFVNGILIGTS